MLKKISVRKIYISIFAIFAMLMIYLIPDAKPNLEVKEELEYVSSNIQKAEVFLMDQSSYVALTEIALKEKDIIEKAKALIKVLTVGGMNSKVPSGFSSILPPDTEVLNISYENNVLKVNFSKEILDINKELEEKMIESLVYTLTSIDKVDKIIIYVEGDILTKLPKTKINLPSSLDRSFGINKEFNLTSTKDISDVTVYYINQIKGNYYYVPVTKYLNGVYDKVNIVIEELSTNTNKDLKSYISEDVKLVDKQIDDNKIELKIESSIESDDIKKNISKTISLSICDNYKINEIIINKEIIKCSNH